MTTAVELGSLIETDPEIRGGRPCLAGTGVSVHRVVTWYRLGLTPEEIGERIGHLSLAQVHAALAYYHANQQQIDREIEADEEEAETLARRYAAPGQTARWSSASISTKTPRINPSSGA